MFKNLMGMIISYVNMNGEQNMKNSHVHCNGTPKDVATSMDNKRRGEEGWKGI